MKCWLQCVNTPRGDANLPGQALEPPAAQCKHSGWSDPGQVCYRSHPFCWHLCLPCSSQSATSSLPLEPECLVHPSLGAKHPQLPGYRGTWDHAAIPGPWLCPWPRCTRLIRNTCVHGISCPSSAFISSASKNPRHAKVKETSQSITQATATRAAETGLSKLNFNSHPMAQPGQP